MKQKLLADIELDVHELKYLMDSFTKEPTQTLSELLKRSVARMQGRLDELSQEIDSVELVSLSSFVVEETVVKENEITAQEKDASVIIQSPKPVIEAAEEEKEEKEEEPVIEEAPVIIKKEEPKNAVLGESIKLAAGLRHSISLNDSFRFSRELFKGDTDLMNRVIEQISVMGSYKTAVAFLSSKVEIDEEKDAVVDFLELLKKYFNQSA
ncbi:hypothetical protein [Bacteroides acidifaciens]|uniref:Uncharacterized protein n=1 Tax=Bacteroides acidifaciens TaxID=85831 RepID=A0A7K3MH67_9BACE|nr:hypothetical protein [Bacteroides acidifaciens]MBF0729903.1 hypothetical protein [Bacteroides acidifaciens]MBF0837591.1 hypothetical protein [Bacteroides acidifaciens]NDO53654.1 hypothetical protein [Bacteroides acidifaciens]TFU49409.1 hypothetical protein E4T97_10250 [Bacteroides acidifaciens]